MDVEILRSFSEQRPSRNSWPFALNHLTKKKIVFFDLGVRNAILGQHENVFSDPQLGPLFEQWIINQCIAFQGVAKKKVLDWLAAS